MHSDGILSSVAHHLLLATAEGLVSDAWCVRVAQHHQQQPARMSITGWSISDGYDLRYGGGG